MATTTTNYGFDIPQSTDLVKDGATAIATLGQDIDTAMNTALGTKKAGMVLLNTTSFSGVATQSVNDVFSATYDNYKIIIVNTSAVGADLHFRVRVSGADLTTNYANIRNVATSSAGFSHFGNYSDTLINLGSSTTSQNSYTIDIFSPFLAKRTQLFSSGIADSSTLLAQEIISASVKNTTSYTGFTMISSSSNFTGSVTVYGYNK